MALLIVAENSNYRCLRLGKVDKIPTEYLDGIGKTKRLSAF